jgi:hypothetical protein
VSVPSAFSRCPAALAQPLAEPLPRQAKQRKDAGEHTRGDAGRDREGHHHDVHLDEGKAGHHDLRGSS